MTENSTSTQFTASYDVSFGDCDPAGIVFYPNIFGWLDRSFHAYLKETAGGHATVCKELSALGLGLVSADCSFRSPLREGDTLTVEIATIDWGKSSYEVRYVGWVGERKAFEAMEKRTMFVETEGRIRAGDVSLLRAQLGL